MKKEGIWRVISLWFKILYKLLLLVFIVLFRYLGMNFSTSGMYSYRSKFFSY